MIPCTNLPGAMTQNELGLVIVGGGSSAFAAALRTSELGRQAVIVNAGPEERGLPLGGTCVNVVCVPSKTMIRAVEAVHGAAHPGFAGIDVDVAKLPLGQVPRALAARDTHGFIKLVRDRETDRLAGARIVAPEGCELLMETVLAIRHGITLRELTTAFNPCLTLSEGIKLAALTFWKDVKNLSCCAAGGPPDIASTLSERPAPGLAPLPCQRSGRSGKPISSSCAAMASAGGLATA